MKLLPLACPQCRDALFAGNQDVVVSCRKCQTHVLIGDEGLQPLPASYIAPPGGDTGAAKTWFPFWMFEAKVNISERKTQGGRKRGSDAEALWGQLRRFFIPAWDLPITQLRHLSSGFVQSPQRMQRLSEKPADVAMTPATMNADDAAKMIEFIVLDIEAKRDDYLRHIHYDVKIVDGPHLVMLPGDGQRLLHRPSR